MSNTENNGPSIETHEKVENMSKKGGCLSAVGLGKLRPSRQGATILDPSRPSKLDRIPCQYAALRTTVSLCRSIDGCKKVLLYHMNFERMCRFIVEKNSD